MSSSGGRPGDRRRLPAPGLTETAEIWWDSSATPLVEWDEEGRVFSLVDGADEGNRLLLWRAADGRTDPEVIARALAEGLAACDFPPTGEGASPSRAAATLRVAGLPHG